MEPEGASARDHAMGVEHELLGRALVEVLVSLRRVLERDHRGADRLRDLRLVMPDRTKS